MAGDDGERVHGDAKGRMLPKSVEGVRGKKRVQGSAGTNHRLVLTESGEVYSFGCGHDGMLGHGDTVKHCLPKLIEALRGQCVVDIAAGNSSLVMTESGDVLEFGRSVRNNKLNILVPDSRTPWLSRRLLGRW